MRNLPISSAFGEHRSYVGLSTVFRSTVAQASRDWSTSPACSRATCAKSAYGRSCGHPTSGWVVRASCKRSRTQASNQSSLICTVFFPTRDLNAPRRHVLSHRQSRVGGSDRDGLFKTVWRPLESARCTRWSVLERDDRIAATNARWRHRDRVIKLFDLESAARPILITVDVRDTEALEVVNEAGVLGNGFTADHPDGSTHAQCQRIGQAAYDEAVLGVACRSAAECIGGHWLGEELALFDTAPAPAERAPRRSFAEWYPDSIP